MEQIIEINASETNSKIAINLENLDRFVLDNRGEKHFIKISEKSINIKIDGKKEELEKIFKHIRDSKNKYEEHKLNKKIELESLKVVAEKLAKENTKLLKETGLIALNKEISILRKNISEGNKLINNMTDILKESFKEINKLKQEIKETKEILFETEGI